jgi:hypothetical protein
MLRAQYTTDPGAAKCQNRTRRPRAGNTKGKTLDAPLELCVASQLLRSVARAVSNGQMQVTHEQVGAASC